VSAQIGNPTYNAYNASGQQRLDFSEADLPQLLQTYSGFLILLLNDSKSTFSPEPNSEQIFESFELSI
jgi:hypothetical protein